MAECQYCVQEMTTAASCTVAGLRRDGKLIPLTPYTASRRRGVTVRNRCGDCGVRPGGYHHLGCDMQRCPLCRGQLMSCECRFDGDSRCDDSLDDDDDEGFGFRFDDAPVDRYFDANGVPTERRWLGGQEVIIHYEDIPDSDKTVVDGIPCTTALRTMIDIAPSVTAEQLETMVRDCLKRKLFTIDEAWDRLAQDDMQTRPGAMRLRELLPALE